MRKSVGTAVAVMVLIAASACSGSEDGGSADDQSVTVGRSDMDGWPLTVESGTLRCDGSGGTGAVTFEANGKIYAVNGVAKGRGLPVIDPIWAPNPKVDGLKIDIGPLINRGLALCK